MNKKRVIVCDYDNPKGYTFPSFGFGSSEKRVWHLDKTLSEIEDFEVIITGPLWLSKYVPNAKYFPKRLNSASYQEFLSLYGKCDYLFAGHEYFDKDEWVAPFEECAEILLSYQLHPYEYKKKSFNGKNKFLFCYSDQMLEQYKEQSPIKALLFHSGVGEDPVFSKKSDDYLLWIGRLDRDKAPHYAVEVAKLLNMDLKILGKAVYQPEYLGEYAKAFESRNVKMLGVKFGKEKMELISKASCAIYTIDKNYNEAGAGVLGEILSCGVPIAGMTWSGNDAVSEAVNDELLGMVVNVASSSEKFIPQKIADAVNYCIKLEREKVYEIGSKKYNPKRLVSKIFKIIEECQR